MMKHFDNQFIQVNLGIKILTDKVVSIEERLTNSKIIEEKMQKMRKNFYS